MEAIWITLQPAIVSVGGVILTTIFSIVGVYLRKYLSDASMKTIQDIFQKGIENAAGVALNKINLKNPMLVSSVLTPNHPDIQEAVEYVKKAVPDTIGKFKLTDFDLGQKIIAKMMVLTAGVPPKS